MFIFCRVFKWNLWQIAADNYYIILWTQMVSMYSWHNVYNVYYTWHLWAFLLFAAQLRRSFRQGGCSPVQSCLTAFLFSKTPTYSTTVDGLFAEEVSGPRQGEVKSCLFPASGTLQSRPKTRPTSTNPTLKVKVNANVRMSSGAIQPTQFITLRGSLCLPEEPCKENQFKSWRVGIFFALNIIS